jgi:hypothetical protein
LEGKIQLHIFAPALREKHGKEKCWKNESAERMFLLNVGF